MVAPYADEYFEYDENERITVHVLAGGSSQYTLEYEDRSDCPGYVPGYNSWEVKTVETRPGGSQNIYYSNYVGQWIVKELRAGSDRWIEYKEYDEDGQVVLHAMPSAVEDYTVDSRASAP